jgi:hypothetical protein
VFIGATYHLAPMYWCCSHLKKSAKSLKVLGVKFFSPSVNLFCCANNIDANTCMVKNGKKVFRKGKVQQYLQQQ